MACRHCFVLRVGNRNEIVDKARITDPLWYLVPATLSVPLTHPLACSLGVGRSEFRISVPLTHPLGVGRSEFRISIPLTHPLGVGRSDLGGKRMALRTAAALAGWAIRWRRARLAGHHANSMTMARMSSAPISSAPQRERAVAVGEQALQALGSESQSGTCAGLRTRHVLHDLNIASVVVDGPLRHAEPARDATAGSSGEHTRPHLLPDPDGDDRHGATRNQTIAKAHGATASQRHRQTQRTVAKRPRPERDAARMPPRPRRSTSVVTAKPMELRLLGWFWDQAPKFIGIAGFLLAVFNQWSIWRDRREKAIADAPRARVTMCQRSPDNTVALNILFTNSRTSRLHLTEVRVLEPKGVGIAMANQPLGSSPQPPARTVTVSWTVSSSDEHGGEAGTRLWLVPLCPIGSPSPLVIGKRLAIEARGTEIDRPTRRAKIVAATVLRA